MILPSKHKVCAIVTSFNPDQNFYDRLERVISQVDKLVIIDNNSGPQALKLLNDISKKLKIYLIFNSVNLGVATALNQGVQWAKKNYYRWVLLLDQDTLVSDKLVEETCLILSKIDNIENVAIIGPSYNNEIKKPFFTSRKEKGLPYKEVRSVITSGSLISIDIFDKIGPFLDVLFIDFVDIEYCLRARSNGFRVLKMQSILMKHSIGFVSMHNLPWRVTGTSNHSPSRRYYMMRNNIIIIRKYFFSDPLWAVVSLITRVKSTILLILFEKQKIAKLKYSALGFVDGLLGKLNRTIK